MQAGLETVVVVIVAGVLGDEDSTQRRLGSRVDRGEDVARLDRLLPGGVASPWCVQFEGEMDSNSLVEKS
jgi:hypothetical protein